MANTVPDVNVGNIMASLASFLMVTIYGSTLQVENNTTNSWTKANTALTTAQVSAVIANPVTDPTTGAVIGYEYTDGSTPEPGETNPYGIGTTAYYQWGLVQDMNGVLTSSDPTGAMASFIDGDFENPAYINVMSEAFGSTVMSLLTQCWDTTTGSAEMATVSSVNAEVTAKANQEESTSTNEMDKEKSQITSTTNEPSNEANLCTSVFQILSTIASALANGIV